MAIPTSYTETTLGEYMISVLGVVGQVLDYSSSSMAEAVNDVLLAYGVDDISQATDIKKLRALSKMVAWKKACDDLVGFYKFSADGGTYDRNQMREMAEKALTQATADATAYDPNYVVGIVRAKPVNDPYRYTPEDDQTL